ncbi:DUF418 domain-containing protein [Sphingomonas sp. C3-2]|uniref:DUF418 domain-containing protein n=1 Tax=Sphingomonas sp. C3-2 TaxID=3062169 RepID=UPI00294A9EA8|nr:DUF418 domain-containing protein [Sphingomonas sp. C3-2]WOK37611.1 DUF418 domain-containing protein [Sphingomonas sp. C3-2]
MDTLPPRPRYLSLDALRGIAVMGILAMNIIVFAMPEFAYVNPRVWGGTSPADIAAWATAYVLVDGKMRGLFSLLFGASMLIVIDAAEARGADGPQLHLRRMGWLLVFGLAHYYLIWFGDILTLYAVIGSFAFLARHGSAGQLIRWGVLSLIIGFLILAAISISILMTASAATAPHAGVEAGNAYKAMISGLGVPGMASTATELSVYRSGYADILAYRMGERASGPLLMVLLSGCEALGLMLMGMGLCKSGFLTGMRSRASYARTAAICYMIGLPPTMLLAFWCITSGFDPIVTFNATFTWSIPSRIILTLAHASAALWLIDRFAGSRMIARIAAAGRAAFSNYLGTSIVMTTIFYGYGLGLFGEVSRAQAYLFVAGGCVVMLAWSKPWLDRFAYGPLEWLWRSLARGGPQEMRKRRTAE